MKKESIMFMSVKPLKSFLRAAKHGCNYQPKAGYARALFALGILGSIILGSLGQAAEEAALVEDNRTTVERLTAMVATEPQYEAVRREVDAFIINWRVAPSTADKTELVKVFVNNKVDPLRLDERHPELLYAYSRMIQQLGEVFVQVYLAGLVDEGTERRSDQYPVNYSLVSCLCFYPGLGRRLYWEGGINLLIKIIVSGRKEWIDLAVATFPTLMAPEVVAVRRVMALRREAETARQEELRRRGQGTG